jgi:hypothetical protein
MKYYLHDEAVKIEDSVFAEGEEGTLHFCYDKNGCKYLAKLFKENRRSNILPISEEMYKLQSEIKTRRYLFPKGLIYDVDGRFCGIVQSYFQDNVGLPMAQNVPIRNLIQEIKFIEEDTKLISSYGIHLGDFKVKDILFHLGSLKMAVTDTGLYYLSNEKNLSLENLKIVNYYLRMGLVWMDVFGHEDMKSIDLPFIYDDLDSGEACMSEVLESEIQSYKVKTLTELKKEYKKQIFY